MDSETLLILEVLVGVGGFSFVMLYAAALILSLRSTPPKARLEEPRARLSLIERPIPMPRNLTTKEEMVDWMVKDLPKLTAKLIETDRA
jgi:hypothetical protein